MSFFFRAPPSHSGVLNTFVIILILMEDDQDAHGQFYKLTRQGTEDGQFIRWINHDELLLNPEWILDYANN